MQAKQRRECQRIRQTIQRTAQRLMGPSSAVYSKGGKGVKGWMALGGGTFGGVQYRPPLQLPDDRPLHCNPLQHHGTDTQERQRGISSLSRNRQQSSRRGRRFLSFHVSSPFTLYSSSAGFDLIRNHKRIFLRCLLVLYMAKGAMSWDGLDFRLAGIIYHRTSCVSCLSSKTTAIDLQSARTA